jgi:hypothetical protein
MVRSRPVGISFRTTDSTVPKRFRFISFDRRESGLKTKNRHAEFIKGSESGSVMFLVYYASPAGQTRLSLFQSRFGLCDNDNPIDIAVSDRRIPVRTVARQRRPRSGYVCLRIDGNTPPAEVILPAWRMAETGFPWLWLPCPSLRGVVPACTMFCFGVRSVEVASASARAVSPPVVFLILG